MESLGKRHRTLRASVADEIRGWILSGDIGPGDRLVEDELAARLEVSRVPVREALSLLEAEGFVDLVPRRGASVAQMSADEAMELFEVRSILEGLAARLAARRRHPESLGSLKEVLSLGRQAVKAGHRDAMPGLHQAFHVALADASGNSHLYDLVANLPAKIEWIFNTQVRARAPVSWPEHVRILEVIREGDEDAAEVLTRAHVQDSAKAFLEMLEQQSVHRRDSKRR